jgi:dihydrolipoamide dehydrogenase
MSEVYDLAVIGAGPAGYVAAIRAQQLGLKTVCIEKREKLGGTCLNVGCIPSKALLQSSEHFHFAQHEAADHGIKVAPKADFGRMMERKDGVVQSLTDGIAGLFKKNKVERKVGTARLTSATTIEITQDDHSESVSAKHILIATGSEPIELPFMPFDEERIVSSTGALALPKIPKRLVVVGAGVIGVELASVYARLGSDVQLVEMLDQICAGMDETLCKTLQQALKKQGLTFHLKSKVTSCDVNKKELTLHVETPKGPSSLNADVILVAIGRKPYTSGLGLEGLGIRLNERGQIPVDTNFRTSVPNIFAIGDVVEGPMLAHKASEEGIAAVECIAGGHGHVHYPAIPNVVYTAPEVAGVGLSEAEAKELGFQIKKGQAYFKGNPRARCTGDDTGIVKVIGDSQSDRVLGVHIVGPHASELIGEGMLAIQKGATVEELAAAPNAHPTLSEAIKEAALACQGKAIHM